MIPDKYDPEKLKSRVQTFWSGLVTRVEAVTFNFTVTDVALANECQRQFKTTDMKFAPGDTGKFTYTFSVGYIGNILDNFMFLIYLMDQGIVVIADMSAAGDGRMIFKELIEAYDRILEKSLPIAEEWTEEDEAQARATGEHPTP